jgi:hypothetical protein
VSPAPRRILFPIVRRSLSEPVLETALVIAARERATLVAAYLVPVPLRLALDAALPVERELAVPLLGAVERRAARAGVTFERRVKRGRSHRHALRALVDDEPYDRLVVTAASDGTGGFSAAEVAWLLRRAVGDIVVLRPGDDGRARP